MVTSTLHGTMYSKSTPKIPMIYWWIFSILWYYKFILQYILSLFYCKFKVNLRAHFIFIYLKRFDPALSLTLVIPPTDTVPLSARNFPASFWDSNWVPPPSLHTPELYGDYSDPWQSYMASLTGTHTVHWVQYWDISPTNLAIWKSSAFNF